MGEQTPVRRIFQASVYNTDVNIPFFKASNKSKWEVKVKLHDKGFDVYSYYKEKLYNDVVHNSRCTLMCFTSVYMVTGTLCICSFFFL